MRLTGVKKFSSRFCCILLALCLIIAAMPAAVFANNADVRDALNVLNGLNQDVKAVLLGHLWDKVVSEATDGQAVTVEEIYSELKTELGVTWGLIVSEETPTSTGKISKASVELIITKALNNKPLFIDLYNDYYGTSITKDIVKSVLGLPLTATDAQVFTELVKYNQPILTQNSQGTFVRNTAISTYSIAQKFGSDAAVFNTLFQEQTESLAVKINNNINANSSIGADDVIAALNIYGLFTPYSAGGVVTPPTGPVTPPVVDPGDNTGNLEEDSKNIVGDNDTETLTNIGNVADSAADAIENATNADSEEAAAKLQAAVTGAIENIIAAAENLATDENKITANDSLNAMLDKVAENISADADVSDAKLVADIVAQTVAGSAKLVDKVESVEKAVEMVIDTIKAAAGVIEKIENAGAENKKAADKIKALADKVAEKAGKYEVKASAEGTKAVAQINDTILQQLTQKIEKVAEVAKSLESKLKENKINKEVEKKIVIDIPVDENIKEVKAELPGNLLKAAKEKAIDKVEVSAGLAKLAVPADFVKEAADAKVVSLEVKKAELTQEQKNSLSEEQKKLISSNAEVFDFNAIVGEKQVSKFDKKVNIKIPYTLKKGEDAEKITVLYLADDGTVKNMIGKYNAETGEVEFSTNHFSKYIVKNYVVNFSDVASGFWAKNSIEAMAAKGIIGGKGAGMYDPEGKVTRAEFAKLITIALGIVDENAKADFPDVSDSAWYSTYVASAKNAGIIKGRPDGTFAPNDTISRQDMAVMIANALKESAPANMDKYVAFTDKNAISDYAMSSVAISAKSEILTGKPGNKMDPKGTATRAEAATIIYRLFNY